MFVCLSSRLFRLVSEDVKASLSSRPRITAPAPPEQQETSPFPVAAILQTVANRGEYAEMESLKLPVAFSSSERTPGDDRTILLSHCRAPRDPKYPKDPKYSEHSSWRRLALLIRGWISLPSSQRFREIESESQSEKNLSREFLPSSEGD